MKYYKFSDATKEEYIIMQTTIDTIDRVTGNDEVEYYYYLSENFRTAVGKLYRVHDYSHRMFSAVRLCPFIRTL